jgi:hypothetical protein
MCFTQEFRPGLTEADMKAILLMTVNTAMADTPGLQERYDSVLFLKLQLQLNYKIPALYNICASCKLFYL